uniref:TIL domain-containing protein n=1 Tax=Parastrongyloides trichosuri TaxID=131310 RepID=A0A0N4ZTB3_PARTI
MVFHAPDGTIHKETSITEEEFLSQLLKENEEGSSLEENFDISDPFIFTTSIPSVSPQPPGIALLVDEDIQKGTTNIPLDSTTVTTELIEPTTKNGDFSFEDIGINANIKTNFIIGPEVKSNNNITTTTGVNYELSAEINNNQDISTQYTILVTEEPFYPTTIESISEGVNKQNSIESDFDLYNNGIDSAEVKNFVNESVLPNITSTIQTPTFTTRAVSSEKEFNNNDLSENNYSNMSNITCSKIEICNPGCAISLDSMGCQKCTCLWIPKFCTETYECDGPEYVCEFGKCLCRNNYIQDMERSGYCISEPKRIPNKRIKRTTINDLINKLSSNVKYENKEKCIDENDCDKNFYCDRGLCKNFDMKKKNDSFFAIKFDLSKNKNADKINQNLINKDLDGYIDKLSEEIYDLEYDLKKELDEEKNKTERYLKMKTYNDESLQINSTTEMNVFTKKIFVFKDEYGNLSKDEKENSTMNKKINDINYTRKDLHILYNYSHRRHKPIIIDSKNNVKSLKNECQEDAHCGKLTKCCIKRWCDSKNKCGKAKFCLTSCSFTKRIFIKEEEASIDIIYD